MKLYCWRCFFSWLFSWSLTVYVFTLFFCETEWNCWLAVSSIPRWHYILFDIKIGVGASKKTVFPTSFGSCRFQGDFWNKIIFYKRKWYQIVFERLWGNLASCVTWLRWNWWNWTLRSSATVFLLSTKLLI